MATTTKALVRQGFPTSLTTLYTVPASTTTVVTSIVVSNENAASRTFTINFDGVSIAYSVTIAANTMTTFDLKQVLATTKTISAVASGTGVGLHISGVEIA